MGTWRGHGILSSMETRQSLTLAGDECPNGMNCWMFAWSSLLERHIYIYIYIWYYFWSYLVLICISTVYLVYFYADDHRKGLRGFTRPSQEVDSELLSWQFAPCLVLVHHETNTPLPYLIVRGWKVKFTQVCWHDFSTVVIWSSFWDSRSWGYDGAKHLRPCVEGKQHFFFCGIPSSAPPWKRN